MQKLKIILLFVLVVTGCKKVYDPLQKLSEGAKSLLPFLPGDTLAFLNPEDERLELIYYPGQTTFFVHESNGTCEECGEGDAEVREVYRSLCYSLSYGDYLILLEADLDWKEAQETGREYEILGISMTKRHNSIVNDIETNEFEIIADSYSEWGDGYSMDDKTYPYIIFKRYDTLVLNNQNFYNVFSGYSSNPVVYYSQLKGIIAFKMDSVIWMNEKYQ